MGAQCDGRAATWCFVRAVPTRLRKSDACPQRVGKALLPFFGAADEFWLAPLPTLRRVA